MSALAPWFAGSPALKDRAPAWLLARREHARTLAASMSWPSTRSEIWRSFDLRPLAALAPSFGSDAATPAMVAAALERLAIPHPAHRLVFIDGRFATEWSDPIEPLAAQGITTLARALVDRPARVRALLQDLAIAADDPIAALSELLWSDGLFVDLAADTRLSIPIAVIRLQDARQSGRIAAARHVIHLGARASLRLLEIDAGFGGEAAVAIHRTEVHAAEGARCDRLRLQLAPQGAWQFSEFSAHLKAGSRVAAHLFATGSNASRDAVQLSLDEPGCEARFDGLFVLEGEQRADHATRVVHQAPHCRSDEAYKGVLADRSKGSFTGRIVVAEGAQKTDAYQSNKNLLLSTEAEIHTRPQLEIYADDVKCSHGATIGQIDPTQLFYLESRGLPEAQARALLVQAFALELAQRIDDPVLAPIFEGAVAERFTAMTARGTA